MRILHRDRDEPAGPGFDGRRPTGTRMAARRRRRHRAVVVGVVVLLVAGLIGADYLIYRDRVHPGVEVAGTELNGQTREEAIATLTALADRIGATPLNFTYEDQTFSTTPTEMGWQPDIEAT